MDDPDYQLNLRNAVVKAVLAESRVNIGNGEQAAHIDVPKVCIVLTEILAGFIASSPDCDRVADVRKVSDAWRTMLHQRILDIIKSGKRLPLFGGMAPPPLH
ncbi:MAG: hypothetical protein JWR80_912 [Bradyrhizobium sp.]|nr:hypothetical protein [Bradyrhizobium sp.]